MLQVNSRFMHFALHIVRGLFFRARPHGVRPRRRRRIAPARPRRDPLRPDRDRNGPQGQGSDGRGFAAPARRERPARRRPAGGRRRHGAAARGVREAAERADAEVEGRRGADRCGDRRAGEREAEARCARREFARGAGHAVAGRRDCDPNRGEAARALRTRNLRQVVERLQPAIVAERLARGADGLPRDDGRDRRLARLGPRAPDPDAGPRHGGRDRFVRARLDPRPLDRAPRRLSRPGGSLAEPVAPRDRRGLDLLRPRGPAPRRAVGDEARSRRVRPFRLLHARRSRRRLRRRAPRDRVQRDRPERARAAGEGLAPRQPRRPVGGADLSGRHGDRRRLGGRAARRTPRRRGRVAKCRRRGTRARRRPNRAYRRPHASTRQRARRRRGEDHSARQDGAGQNLGLGCGSRRLRGDGDGLHRLRQLPGQSGAFPLHVWRAPSISSTLSCATVRTRC